MSFSESYYLTKYPDIANAIANGLFGLTSGLQHYLQSGRDEGRQMLTGFSEEYYLAKYPDVAAAVAAGQLESGAQHYALAGQAEGRQMLTGFSEAYYLAKHPDVAAAVEAGQLESAVQHYALAGQAEGRQVLTGFSEAYYLAKYPDVAAAVAAGQLESAVQHYALAGQAEGRQTIADFNEAFYLAAHPDVAAAVASGQLESGAQHFALAGQAEGRAYLPYAYNPVEPVVPQPEVEGKVFTLKQSTVDITDTVETTIDGVTTNLTPIETIKETYWGNGEDNGVPIANLTALITQYFTQKQAILELFDFTDDMAEITNITLAGVTDQVQDETDTDTVDLGGSNASVGNDGDATNSNTYTEEKEGDYTGNYTLTVTLADGSTLDTQVELTAQEYEFFTSVLFNDDGSSRLFEVVTNIYPEIILKDTAGNPVLDADGNPITYQIQQYVGADITEETEVVTGSRDVPLVLTTAQNNGSTVEGNVVTTAGDDLIVVGNLDLLHGAYIDAGAGFNTLEIDAKGYFAQPKQLLNIQQIHVQNLPNIYTDVDADGNVINQYPDLVENPTEVHANSIIDLSRAIDVVNVKITEGAYTGLDNQEIQAGTLTVTGVRSDATLMLEGAFTQTVNVNYSTGLGVNNEGINVVLRLGDVAPTVALNFAHNANTININSQGGGNVLADANFGNATLTNMNISGDAKFVVVDSIAAAFTATHVATINASENTAGVDLTVSGRNTDDVVFVGTQAADSLTASNNRNVTIDSGAGSDEIVANDNQTVMITAGSGNNQISATTTVISATVTAEDGDNQVDVSESAMATVTLGDGENQVLATEVNVLAITLGDGENQVVATDSTESVTVTLGNGDNTVNLADGAKIVVVAGNGDNAINANGATDTVTMTLGDGANQVTATEVTGASVTITAGNGGNTIDVSDATGDANITTGTGDDVIVAEGMTGDVTVNAGAGNNDITIDIADNQTVTLTTSTGDDAVRLTGNAKLVMDLGAGENTLTLAGVAAQPGSSISGSNIKLVVTAASDLTNVDLTGVTSVVLSDLDALSTLRLTDAQFAAIGAANFSVAGSVFTSFANLEIIVTENNSLTAMGADSLSANVNLVLDIADGATLTMTAEQLHTKVAPQGVGLLNDATNEDVVSGKVVVTGGGLNFDPFNTSDVIKSVIAGNEYNGGSLSQDFMVGTDWYNVTVQSTINGYDRPADAPVVQVLTLDSGTGLGELTQGAFTTSVHNNLSIVGERDIQFTGDINLGENFTIDFSQLEGQVLDMSITQFQDVKEIHGNGDATIHVKLENRNNTATERTDTNGAAADAAEALDPTVGQFDADGDLVGGLISSGISNIVVTDIVDINVATTNTDAVTAEVAIINLCDQTADLEVVALRANYDATLVVNNAAWGVNFELQGGSTKKADGPTATSNVGALIANYEWDGADAVVNLVHSVSGDTRTIKAYGVTINNADSITINTGTASALVDLVEGDSLNELVVTSDASVTIGADMAATVTTINASGVDGNFTVASDVTGEVDFTFVGSAANTSLTLNADYTATADSSFTSAGNLTLIVDADSDVDLTAADVSGISAVVINTDATLALTIAQAEAIGTANFSGAGSLTLSGLGEEPFAKSDYDVAVTFDTLEVIDQAAVELHADTDLTGIATLLVNAGTTLSLTAAQFQQLTAAGTITGSGNNVTVNITDLTQADVDAGFSLTGITGATVIINLAESITMPANASMLNADVINMPAGAVLAVRTFEELDAVEINGGANTSVRFLDSVVDNDPGTGGIQYPSIDASGFNVTQIEFLNLVAGDINVDEQLFVNLPSSVTKVVYNGEGMATPVSQTVIINAGSSIDGNYTAFNKSGDAQNDVEITQFTITLAGGVNIGGDIELSTAAKDNAFSGNELLKVGLQTLVINSTGTAENIFTGETANVMGTVTPRADNVVDATDNRLTDVQINATQDLIMEGIVFNSWSEANAGEADGWSINDNLAATATVTVTGDADVNLGLLDSSDNEVDALVVVNNGTGTVAAIISDASVDATDALSFTGTGDITLTVEGEVDLSNDNLTAVTQITLADNAELTLSQAQVVALGAANIVVATGDDAILNINAFSGAVVFDAAAFDADLDIGTITLAAGTHTLTGDFTNVDTIIVPAGSVLNLTAAQFQQLTGAGAIVGVAGTTAYTVNITDLSQADIDAGTFDTTGISAATLTLTLAGNVNLSADDVIENVDTLIMADGQRLGIATATQADDLVIDGGTNTTVSLDFDVNAGVNIDADGYDVSNLRVWSTAVNNSDVEAVINNLPETVTLVIVEDALQVADITAIDRQVVIEPGVAVPGFLVFNGDDSDRKLRTLEITFQGDATDRTEQEDFDSNIEGSVINGNLIFDYDPTLLANGQDVKFHTLTLNSTGVGSSNAINGDISPLDNDAAGNNINNNLLNVVVNADAAFTVNGSVIFNSEDAGLTQATLTVNGTAPVSIENLDVDGGVSTLTVNNAGTGALTITGASPSVTSGDAESLVITGASLASSITFGTAELAEDFADGIDGNGVLSVINASGFAGTLSIETVTDVDVNLFTFTAGSGETTVNFRGVTVDQDADPLTDSGFTINFANAAVGSEVHFSGANTYTDGALSIDLGANTTLYIDANTNWTSLDLTLAQTQAIVVAAGTTLTLTAAQANGLEIIGNGTVNITQLGNDAYDFSGIAANIAGTITLEDNDVTVNAATDLGDFSITLDDLDLGLTGQTIRFNTIEQAERDVFVVNDLGGDDSTNVVWLFNSVSAPVNTDGYDNDLGRLWISQTLADGANVEQLFTSLPTSIVRVEFTDLREVNFALASAAVNRTVELVAFTDLPAGISFADGDRYEHVQSLTINMGGDVNVGSLEIDNIIAPSTNPLELDPTGIAFTSLTINSERALRDTHILAPELYVNDNDGTPEEGENVQPGNVNVIGDISVGTNNGLDLLTVNINTLTASVVGNGSDGAGADLQIRTITFDAATALSEATLNVTGDNDVTIKSLDTSDADISTLTVNVGTATTAFNGTLTVTGGSPAAAVSNTEELIIVLRGIESPRGEVNFGTATDTVNNVPFAGVAGAALSLIEVNIDAVAVHSPNEEFAVDLGVIAQVDSLDFVLIGNDETIATLGSANVDGVVMAPSLAAGGEWTFNDAVITLADTVTLGAGDVTFDGVTLTIDGDVDFTTLANLTLTDTTIDVPAGSSITILASDISGVTVTGAGVVNVVAVEDFVTLDLSDVMTNEGDTGTVTALVDTADGTDVDLLPDTVILGAAADLGIAAVTVIGAGTLDVTNVPVANLEATIDRDPTGTTSNETVMVTFAVASATTLVVTAAQADERTTTGAGTTNIEDIGIYANANAIDYSAVNTASVNIAVDTSVTLEAGDNLGAAGAGRVTTIASGVTLTSAGSVVDGQYITGSNGTLLVDDENTVPTETPITANLSNVSAEFITLVDTAEVGTITFPVLYGDPDAVPAEDVQTVTLTANQASNQTIVGGAVAGTEGAVVVTNLSNNTDTTVPVDGIDDVATVNFANINAATMVANAPATTTLAATSDLGNFDITLGDEDATADAVVFTLTAGQADGLNITAVDLAEDTVTVAVTALEATPNADLSGIAGVDVETAALDADGDVTLGANLGADMVVTISDSDTNTADTVTFTGDMTNASTEFVLAADDLTLVLDAADANDLNVTETAGGVDNSTVIVNNLVNNASSLLGGPIDEIDVDFSDIVADTMTANVAADSTLSDAADIADFALVLADGVDLTLSTTQLLTIGEADFSGTAAGAGAETLIVTAYNGENVQSDALGANLTIAQLVVLDTNATVTANAAADFTRVQEIVIPEGTTFSMTADQFISMPTGVVSGLGTLVITAFDNDNRAIDLSTVTAVAGTISLDATAGAITATSPELTVTNPIVLDPLAVLDTASGDQFEIVFTAEDQAITLSTESQADGRVITGRDGSVLILGFTSADAADANPNMVATGFSVDTVYVLNEYLANEFSGVTPANIENMLFDLDEAIEVTIYDVDDALNANLVDPSAVETTTRVVNVEPDTFVDASIAFNDLRATTEVRELTINLNGNSVIDGNVTLPQDTDPMSLLPTNYVQLFEELTINSENNSGVVGNAPNEIDGNIIANIALAGAESRVEQFTIDFAGVSIVGSQEEIGFAGVVVNNLDNGDGPIEVAAAVAAAINGAFGGTQPVWYANDNGDGTVTFTAISAGAVNDVTIADFSFTQNDPLTVLASAMSGADITIDQQGSFAASENNLLLVNINATHELEITGTIEFSYVSGSEDIDATDDLTATAELNVSGDANVTVGSVNTSDEHITALTFNNSNTATVTIPGTSPGAAVGNTEELIINNTGDGDLVFGTAGDLTKPGVAGADLSLIEVTGDGTVDLGVLAMLDGEDFTLDTTGLTTGIVTAELRADMAAGGEWTFDNTGTGTLNLTIVGFGVPDTYGSETVYGTGPMNGTLTLNNVDLTFEGDLDLSQTTLVITNGTLVVAAGATLMLTVQQAEALGAAGVIITGDGTVEVTGEFFTDTDPVDFGAALQTVNVDLSAVTLGASGDPLATPANLEIVLTGAINSLGVAAGQNIIGTDFADLLQTTNTLADTISGGLLNDTLIGAGGADLLNGNDGDDDFVFTDVATFTGATVAGGQGTDTIVLTDNAQTIVDANFTGSTSVEVLETADGANQVTLAIEANAAGIATVIGGTGVDVVLLEDDTAGHTLTIQAIEGLEGSLADDVITADSSLSLAQLDDGDDSVLFSEAGIGASVEGGAGADSVTLVGDSGDLNTLSVGNVESVTGGDADDTVLDFGTLGIDPASVASLVSADLGAGDDDLNFLVSGVDATVEGGLGDDNVSLTGSADDLNSITITGFESLSAGDAEDTIVADASLVDAELGADDDSLSFSVAGVAATVDGGAGDDSVTLSGVALETNSISVENVESVIGGLADDTITVLLGATSVEAGDGADSIVGGAGIDTINGGNGNDTIAGGGASDIINAGAGDDVVIYEADDVTVDSVDGGADTDTISAASATAGVTIDLSSTTDAYINFENLLGSDFADDLTGDADVNLIEGGLLNDTLEGGAGADTLDGGDGLDWASYEGSATAVSVNLATATYVGGDALGDTLTSIENLRGSAHNDTLTGDAQDNALEGLAGNDTLNGGDGDDTMTGGADVDTFVMSGAAAAEVDNIMDWGHGRGDIISGELGVDDRLNVTFGTLEASAQGAPSTVDATVTPAVNDTIVTTSVVANATATSFTVTALTAGDVLYLSHDGVLTETGTNPATYSGQEFTWTVPAGTLAEKVLSLQNALDTAGYGPSLTGTGPYTFTLSDTPGAGVTPPTAVNVATDNAVNAYVPPMPNNATVTFANEYDPGDILVLTINAGEASEESHTHVVQVGATSGNDVALAFEAMLEQSVAVSRDDDLATGSSVASVAGNVLTITNDNGDGAISGTSFTVDMSITEVNGLLFDGWALGTGVAATNGVLNVTGANPVSGVGGDDTIIGGVNDDTLLGGEGADVLWGFSGNNTLQGDVDPAAGDAVDKFIIVGDLSTADSTKIQLINTTLQDMIGYDPSLDTTHTVSDVATGGTLVFDTTGNDELHAFGTVDLTGVNITNTYVAFSYSTLILTPAQLALMQEIHLVGTSEHTIVLVDDVTGEPLAEAEQQTIFQGWVDQAGKHVYYEAGAPAYEVAGVLYEAADINTLTGEGAGLGSNPNSSNLTFDIGNGDRDGNGLDDNADDDSLFDDALTSDGDAAEVMIGDRLQGFGAVTEFTPGETALPVPPGFDNYGDDEVDDGQFEVYYGTYDAEDDIFTVTSTPGTTADPRTATHTMVLYDNDTSGDVNFVDGLVFTGVYAEQQWFINDNEGGEPTLEYAVDAVGMSSSGDLEYFGDEENVYYGTDADEVFGAADLSVSEGVGLELDSAGIDIIYAGGGGDILFGGMDSAGEDFDAGVAGGDWLFGEAGADTFAIIPQYFGGTDWIKDFNVVDGDVIVFLNAAGDLASLLETATIPTSASGATADYIATTVQDSGSIIGGSLFAAMSAEFTSTDTVTAYQFVYDSKTYLMYDALGDGFQGNEYLVEITGITGSLTDANVLTPQIV